MKRTAILLALTLPAAGCTDPCTGAAPTQWQKYAAQVGAALASTVSLTPVTPQSQLMCTPTPGENDQAIEMEGDAGTCGQSTGDGACIACLKTSCCAEYLACDAACLAAGSGDAYDAMMSCGTGDCAGPCGGPQ